MPLITAKLFEANKKTVLDTAVATYKAGVGAALLDYQRGSDMHAVFNESVSHSRLFLILAHGGLDIPSSGNKTAVLQHIYVEEDKLSAAQAALDDALALVVHAESTSGDTTVANLVTVTSTTFFADEDVGRFMTVDGGDPIVITSVDNNGVAATGSLTTIDGDDLTDGDNFIVDDGVNPAVTFEFDNNSSVTETAILRQIVFIAGVAATGSLTALAQASLTDGDLFVIEDGTNPAVTFHYDVTGTYTPGGGYDATNIRVNISGDTTDINVADTTRTAMGTATLDITPDVAGAALINLTNDATGAQGNVTITETLSSGTLTPVGMSGGVTASTSEEMKTAIIAAFVAAPTLDVTASDGGVDTVDLVNDDKFNGATGNVAITDNVTDAGFVISGMSAGSDATTLSAAYAGTALASDTGLDVQLLGAEVLQSLSLNVYHEADREWRFMVMAACEGELA